MSTITLNELRTLTQARDGPCVSIYLPTHRIGPESQQDPIRLKNLLAEAEERLIAGGLRRPDAERLLAPAYDLALQGAFRKNPCDGLALFVAPDLFAWYCLPLAFTETVVTGNRFHIKPLLPLIAGDGRFYILAISQNDVRLLECTRDTVEPVEVPGLPTSMEEALGREKVQQMVQFYADRAAGGSSRTAIWYGHGGEKESTKELLVQYFQRIDERLWQRLRNESAPMVLAAVDYLIPLYHSVNTYPFLTDKGIVGSPDRQTDGELHRRGWAIVQPIFEQTQANALARYQAWAGTGLTSSDLREILPAAAGGRVEALFVALDHVAWGRFDPESGDLELHLEQEPGDVDLLDEAVVETLRHSGEVYPLDRGSMPEGSGLVALFRY